MDEGCGRRLSRKALRGSTACADDVGDRTGSGDHRTGLLGNRTPAPSSGSQGSTGPLSNIRATGSRPICTSNGALPLTEPRPAVKLR